MDFVLIVSMPDSQGPNTWPVQVYGPAGKETLETAGHDLCDGSSGWEFIVLPEQVWRTLSSQTLEPPEWGAI